MVIWKFGTELRKIEASDIETIRVWRNQLFVRKNMQFDGEISEIEQQQWYASLDKTKNHYFIFGNKKVEVGLIHLKNIDGIKQTAEAGIFIGRESYLNHPIAVAATMALMDYAFETLHLNELTAKMNERNGSVLKFNLGLGYKFQNKYNQEFSYYKVSAKDYFHSTSKLRNTLEKLSF